MRIPVDLSETSRLMNHGPAVLVSAAHGGQRNLMAAAWTMPLDFDPPKVAVVIDKSTFTRDLIAASGQFALQLPCQAQADSRVFSSGRWQFEAADPQLRTLHHLAGGRFLMPGDSVQASLLKPL